MNSGRAQTGTDSKGRKYLRRALWALVVLLMFRSDATEVANNEPAAQHKKLQWLIPGVLRAFLANQIATVAIGGTVEERQARFLAEWNLVAEIRDRHVTVGRAYDAALSRGTRLEAKAIGVVQIGSIIAAVVAVVLTKPARITRIFAGISLFYLALAIIGALCALSVKSQAQVLVADARSRTAGIAETAAAAAALEERGTLTVNYVYGALIDMRVGGVAALVALGLLLGGVGTGASPPAQQLPVVPAVAPTSTQVCVIPMATIVSLPC